MVVNLCCPGGAAFVAMLAIASRDATSTTCNVHAGPRAFATGVLFNGSCAYCTNAGTVETCSEGMLPGTIAYPGEADRSGCTGRWCLSCGQPFRPPPGATIFVSSNCGFFDDAGGGPPTVAVLPAPLINVTLVVGAAGVRLNASLELSGNCQVVGGPIHVDTSGCGVILTNTPGHTTINTTIESTIYTSASECGVSVAPAHYAVGVTADVTVGSIVSPRSPFFGVATANVAGTIVATVNSTSIMLDRSHTHRIRFDGPWDVTNLSAYLAVFGAEYEIAYFHDGARTIAAPPWVGKLAAANKILAPIAAVVTIAILRMVVLAPPKPHLD